MGVVAVGGINAVGLIAVGGLNSTVIIAVGCTTVGSALPLSLREASEPVLG